jgi:hypothetical protein
LAVAIVLYSCESETRRHQHRKQRRRIVEQGAGSVSHAPYCTVPHISFSGRRGKRNVGRRRQACGRKMSIHGRGVFIVLSFGPLFPSV